MQYIKLTVGSSEDVMVSPDENTNFHHAVIASTTRNAQGQPVWHSMVWALSADSLDTSTAYARKLRKQYGARACVKIVHNK